MLNHIIEANPITWAGNKLFKPASFLSDLATHFSSLLSLNSASSATHAQKLLFCIGLASITYKIAHFIHQQYKMWNWIPNHYHNAKNFKSEQLK